MGHRRSIGFIIPADSYSKRGRVVICRWNGSVEAVDLVISTRIFFFFIALCFMGFSFGLQFITSLLGSFSISLSEDGDEGTEPCEGLYLNVRV